MYGATPAGNDNSKKREVVNFIDKIIKQWYNKL